MQGRVLVSSAIGITALIFGVGLLTAPSLFYAEPVAILTGHIVALGTTLIMLLIGVGVGIYLLYAGRQPPSDPTPQTTAEQRYDAMCSKPPEHATKGGMLLAAGTVEGEIERAVSNGGRELESVRSLLIDTATATYAEWENIPREQARTGIESGEWTSETVAATFLAGDSGPTPTYWDQIRLWLRPERERKRRIERTVSAIEALHSNQ